MWERPAVRAHHLVGGWGRGIDLELRFYRLDQYPQVWTTLV